MNKIVVCICVMWNLFISAQRITPFYGPFPEPTPHKHLMFYLQRTIDRNTVVYQLNYDLDGELNLKKPFNIYWIEFEDGGKIKPLTFAQNKLAYGIEADLIDETNRIFRINLVSYKKVKMFLKPVGKPKQYQTHVDIKGKPAVLSRIQVNITGGTHMSPHIASLELTGRSVATGKIVTERIIPDEK